MRFGTPWRLAVFASLVLLMSGQLCMVTTCVPRLHRLRGATSSMASHACCRTTPVSSSPARSSRTPGAMPCDVVLNAAVAPELAAAPLTTLPATLVVAAAAPLAPPAHAADPFAEADTGPPHERHTPAPAGLRAPPQA